MATQTWQQGQQACEQQALPHKVGNLSPALSTCSTASTSQSSSGRLNIVNAAERGPAAATTPELAPAEAGELFVPALAHVLTTLATQGGRPTQLTRFHSIRPPQLSIHDYLMRLSRYFQCSQECFVLSLVYIDRVVKLHPRFAICNLNIHRLLVTSTTLAAKFFDDVYYSNAYYAKVGGVTLTDLNIMEKQFLSLIDYRLMVSPEEYDQYRSNVLTAVQGTPAIV